MKKGWKTFFLISAIVAVGSIIEQNQQEIDELETRLDEESVENMDTDELAELTQERYEEDVNSEYEF